MNDMTLKTFIHAVLILCLTGFVLAMRKDLMAFPGAMWAAMVFEYKNIHEALFGAVDEASADSQHA